jgi:1-acyl-sn-glycerol-3-phosphate acyltransferase
MSTPTSPPTTVYQLPFKDWLWFFLVRLLIRFCSLFVLISYHNHGRENLPTNQPFMICANHMSFWDTQAILVGMPILPWKLFAKGEWRHHPIAGPLLGQCGAIFVNRGEADRQAIKEAMEAIAQGHIFGIAPEGTRSKTQKLMEAKDGASYLASRANLPIIPIAVINTAEWKYNIRRLRWSKLHIIIGEPFHLPDLGRRVKSHDLPLFTHLIMVKIAQLLPERYHGFYADSPALAALQQGADPWPVIQAMYAAPAEGEQRDEG